jgi:hypothetical protein
MGSVAPPPGASLLAKSVILVPPCANAIIGLTAIVADISNIALIIAVDILIVGLDRRDY